QKEFHFLLLVVMAINYNFVISVLTTNSGIDNLRYRVPVEPLILMVFMCCLYVVASWIFKSFKQEK
ncbi:MAG: hypothetical protein MUP98_16265, partial [Candidatus Aminicenantes bacterium]|nr:hypothetical protein [Candidatus Aminicenantes bacterium]